MVKPIAKEVDADGMFPVDSIRQAGEMGLMGVSVPEQWGGSGMDVLSYCLVIEEISAVCGSTGVILSVNNSLVCDPLLKWANDEQKEQWLKPLAEGDDSAVSPLPSPAPAPTPRPYARRRCATATTT